MLSAAESKALELAKKSARMAMFRDTSGGAYSYLDAEGRMFVPGADNTVVMIPIRDHRIIRDEMVLLDLNREIEQGSWAEVVWRMVGGRIAEAWDIPAVHTARPQTH